MLGALGAPLPDESVIAVLLAHEIASLMIRGNRIRQGDQLPPSNNPRIFPVISYASVPQRDRSDVPALTIYCPETYFTPTSSLLGLRRVAESH